MTIIISQTVKFENDSFPYRWEKTYESSTVPCVGTQIESSLWKDPYSYDVIESYPSILA